MRFYPDNFGKTVFLIREQAEAALAAWEGDDEAWAAWEGEIDETDSV